MKNEVLSLHVFDSGDLGQGSRCSTESEPNRACVGGLVKDTLREWQI